MPKPPEQFNLYDQNEAKKEASEMTKKIKLGEAKDYEEAEKIVEKEKINFNEMVEEIINKGNLEYRAEYWNDDESNYPENVVKILKSISKEEIISAVKNADFGSIDNKQINGWGGPKETAIGTVRHAFSRIISKKDYIIRANMELLHLNGEDPKIKVTLLAENPNGEYNGSNGYPCAACYGNACWVCDFSGGNG